MNSDQPTHNKLQRERRYSCTNILRFPAGGNLEIVQSTTTQVSGAYPSEAVDLLLRCRTLKTVEEHTKANAQFFNEGSSAFAGGAVLSSDSHLERVNNQILSFINSRLMISDEEILELCRRSAARSTESGTISTVCVITRDRPESMERCLKSFIERCERHRRRIDFAVGDDTSDPGCQQQVRTILHRLSSSYGVKIRYAGLRENVAFSEAISSEGNIPVEVVKFALCGDDSIDFSPGANRNALLLHATGRMLLIADDDAVCDVATLDSPRGLSFDSANEFIKFWFFPNRESALQSMKVADADILAIHEQLLGKSVRTCVADLPEAAGLNLAHTTFELFRALMSDDGRNLITSTGMIGDSGLTSPNKYLTLKGDSRRRLTKTASDYASAFTSREIARTPLQVCITDNPGHCMGLTLGYDNRDILPPFLPVGRGEDFLFGQTLRVCFRDGFFGYLPWMIVHAPPDQRRYAESDMWHSPLTFYLGHVVSACIGSVDLRSCLFDERERLRLLGNHLITLGKMPIIDFVEFVQIQMNRSRSFYAAFLGKELEASKDPPLYWANDIKKTLEILRNRMLAKLEAPYDLQPNRSWEKAWSDTQHIVFRFGQVLYWWPDIVKTAGRLSGEGVFKHNQ
jgi:hypothetical protein